MIVRQFNNQNYLIELQLLFAEADTERRGALDLQQFKALVEQNITKFPQVEFDFIVNQLIELYVFVVVFFSA